MHVSKFLNSRVHGNFLAFLTPRGPRPPSAPGTVSEWQTVEESGNSMLTLAQPVKGGSLNYNL